MSTDCWWKRGPDRLSAISCSSAPSTRSTSKRRERSKVVVPKSDEKKTPSSRSEPRGAAPPARTMRVDGAGEAAEPVIQARVVGIGDHRGVVRREDLGVGDGLRGMGAGRRDEGECGGDRDGREHRDHLGRREVDRHARDPPRPAPVAHRQALPNLRPPGTDATHTAQGGAAMSRCSGHEPSRAHFAVARPRPAAPARSRRPWVEHWLDTCGDLQALKASHPMMDAVIDEIDGRMIRIGDHWLADFASCNYLGFDLDREIIEAIPAYLDTWGTHPSWSRLLGSPVIYEEIETRLTAMLGSEDSLVLPTITHIHMSVIPLLAASGTIFLDSRAHKTIYDGCQVARARGAAVKRFRFEDPDHLDQLLTAERDPTRLVCMDGVNSMTGNAPDIRAFAAVARKHGALLYVDDAHGFGVIGERRADESCTYGATGNSVIRHCDETYDDIVLVAGFSKAYSSLLAFIACPTEVKDLLKVAAAPYLYSGPSPVASLASVLVGFDVNERRGDELRRVLHAHSGARARLPAPARRPHPEPLGLPDHRDPAARPRAHRRRRPAAVRARRLRDARGLPARPA